jgi:cytochrome b561
MKTIKPTIAAAEVVLIFPAVLFMTSLFVRELQPIQYEPAHTAQRIVDWYAARVHLGLWVLLIALPLTVTATGCATLLRAWRENAELRQTARQTIAAIRAHLATLFVAAATLAAGGILAIVALHMLTD